MSLRSKMLAVSTIPVVVLIFAVVYAVAAQTTASRTNAEVDRTNTVRQLLAEIQDDLAVAESSVRGFLLTGRQGMRMDYEEAVATLRSDLEDLDIPLRAALQRKRLDRLQELVDERLDTFSAALGVGSGRTPPDEERLVTLLMHGQTITDTMRGLTEQMRLTADELVAQQISARDASFRRSYLVQVVAMPAAVFAAMILMASFTAGIVKRVGRIRHNAKRLDEGRPLDEPDSSQDELGVSPERSFARDPISQSSRRSSVSSPRWTSSPSSPTGAASSRSRSTNSWSRHGRGRASRCCSWTWTASRTSTTSSVIPWATCC